MKKLILIILIIALLAILCSCSETEIYTAVSNEAPYLKSYYFESLIDESDVIAEIEITENLGEVNEPSHRTYFKAEVLTVIKGNEDMKSLNFIQGVNSDYIYAGYPIFTVGQKLVLFLKKTTGEEFAEDMYWIKGDYLSVIKIDTVGDKEYANKLYGTFKDFKFKNEENVFKSLRYERDKLFDEFAKIMD